MINNPDHLPEKFRVAYEAYANAEARAEMAHEMVKVTEAEVYERDTEGPQETRKMQARQSERYREAVAKAVAAKTAMRCEWAKVKAIEMQFEQWRTQEASNRAQMNLR